MKRPGLLKRVGAAFAAYKGATRLVGPIGGLPTFFRSLLPGTSVDYEGEAGDPYSNSVVSIAVGWLWRQLLYPVPQVEQRDKTKQRRGKSLWVALESHPFIDALQNPLHYGWSSRVFGTLVSLVCRGNAYWLKARSLGGQVVGFVYLPHHLIEARADKGNESGTRLVTYYRYTPPGSGVQIDLPTSEIVHFRWGVDPKNMAMGLSPLFAVLRSIVGENRAETLTGALLENGGIVGIVISPKPMGQGQGSDQPPPSDPDDRQEFFENIRRTTTRDRAGRPLYLEFPADVTTVGPTPEQMAMPTLRAVNASRICGAIGVDPMVLGLPSENKTYSNMEEAIEAAYEGTVDPLLKVISEALTDQCFRTDFAAPPGLRFGWDVSDVPAKQEDEDALFTRATSAWKADLVQLNESREMIGYAPVDGGDVFFSDKVMDRLAKTQELTARASEGKKPTGGEEDEDE